MSKFKKIILVVLFFMKCVWSEKEYCERYYTDKQLASISKCGGYLYLQDSIIKNGTAPGVELGVNEALYRCLNYIQMKRECGKASDLPYTGSKYR